MSATTTSRARRSTPDAEPGAGRLRSFLARHHSGPWGGEATALAVVVGLLLVVGLVMSFSASVVDAAEDGDPFGILRRQAAWAAIGVPAFLLVAAIDHRLWRRLSWGLLGASLIGLVLVLVPGLGLERGGSTRWIGLGPLVVQPSEIAKISILLWLADVHQRKRPADGAPFELSHLLVPAVPLLAVTGLLVMAQPDLGTTVVLAIIVGLVLYVDGLPLRVFGAFALAGTILVGLLALAAPYRVARITGWLNPEADPTGTGFQLLQSLYALGSGGWFGLGLGSSRGKWNFVPNPETDFVFAIIGEELGLVGAMVVLLLFGALLVLGLRVARRAPTGFARTVAFGITGWLVAQAMINVATVVGLLPITGMTLPLVSAGGSSLVSTLVALGILVSIARDPDTQDLHARTAP